MLKKNKYNVFYKSDGYYHPIGRYNLNLIDKFLMKILYYLRGYDLKFAYIMESEGE